MKHERRHQSLHNLLTVLSIEIFNDDHDIRGHEDSLVLLVKHLFEKEDALIPNDPVCPDGLDAASVSKCVTTFEIFTHFILVEVIINVRTLVRLAGEDV